MTALKKALSGYVAVPMTNVVIDVIEWFEEVPHDMVVRCAGCGKRLFNFKSRREFTLSGASWLSGYYIERLCPKCKRLNTIGVTATKGYPVGDSKRWVCECGGFLGKIDAPRGRIILSCRCNHEIRVSAIDAAQAAIDDYLSIPF
jgi:phage FluMu protein Com